MDKLLDIILWSVVGIALIIFVSVIMVGHATSFRFLSSIVGDQSVLATNVQFLLSKLSSSL